MPANTTSINCPVADWTLVANGKTNVLIKARSTGELRFHVGQAKPAANTLDFVTGREFSTSVLGSTDKVYVMPYSDKNEAVVEVITL